MLDKGQEHDARSNIGEPPRNGRSVIGIVSERTPRQSKANYERVST